MNNISKINFEMFQRIIAKHKLLIIIIILSFQFFVETNINAQTTSINVNLDQKYQTIDNFSASDCWWAHIIGNKWTTANKDSVADLLFSTTKGIGLSAWRFNLGGGLDAAYQIHGDLLKHLKSHQANMTGPRMPAVNGFFRLLRKEGLINLLLL